MRFLGIFDGLSLTTIIIIAVVFIVVVIVLAILINSGKYAARYKNFYRKMDKAINKKFNGNILNENIVNQYAKDQTNTFKSLKGKGKGKVKKYFDYYVKNLPELVMLKSFTSSDKNKNQVTILLLDEYDKVLYTWHKGRKTKGFIKACDKYQMLTAFIGFLYELPLNIHEGAPYRFTNHDNEYVLTYKIVKSVKQHKRKEKEHKLSKKELKAQARVEKTKEKKAKKKKR